MSDEHTASSEEWTPKGETRSMPMNDVEIPENYASVLLS